MKKLKRAKAPPPLAPLELADFFTRGLVGVGLLTALQNRAAGAPPTRAVARLALQGGFATAAGYATAQSLRRQDYLSAAIALAGGVAGVMAVETLLASETREPEQEAEIG